VLSYRCTIVGAGWTMRRRRLFGFLPALLAALCCGTGVEASQEPLEPVARYTAVAARRLADGQRSESALEIVVTHWTSSEELDALGHLLNERGQDAFAAALRARPTAGAMHEFLRRPAVARRVHALSLALDCASVGCVSKGVLDDTKGRQILVLITNEAGGVSFLLLELDANGLGEGVLVDDAALRYKSGTGMFHLTALGRTRARLTNVQAAPPSR
jgi:hypothetical protein